MNLILLLTIAFIIEGMFTSMPIFLSSLLIYYIATQSSRIFLLGFIFGIFLDLLKLHVLGISSIYFVIILFLVSLYRRKFEIATIPFVFFSSFFGSIGYLLLFNESSVVVQSVVSAVIAVVMFIVILQDDRINV